MNKDEIRLFIAVAEYYLETVDESTCEDTCGYTRQQIEDALVQARINEKLLTDLTS